MKFKYNVNEAGDSHQYRLIYEESDGVRNLECNVMALESEIKAKATLLPKFISMSHVCTGEIVGERCCNTIFFFNTQLTEANITTLTNTILAHDKDAVDQINELKKLKAEYSEIIAQACLDQLGACEAEILNIKIDSPTDQLVIDYDALKATIKVEYDAKKAEILGE